MAFASLKHLYRDGCRGFHISTNMEPANRARIAKKLAESSETAANEKSFEQLTICHGNEIRFAKICAACSQDFIFADAECVINERFAKLTDVVKSEIALFAENARVLEERAAFDREQEQMNIRISEQEQFDAREREWAERERVWAELEREWAEREEAHRELAQRELAQREWDVREREYERERERKRDIMLVWDESEREREREWAANAGVASGVDFTSVVTEHATQESNSREIIRINAENVRVENLAQYNIRVEGIVETPDTLEHAIAQIKIDDQATYEFAISNGVNEHLAYHFVEQVAVLRGLFDNPEHFCLNYRSHHIDYLHLDESILNVCRIKGLEPLSVYPTFRPAAQQEPNAAN
jgi:hypothetical protein